ncbi:MAG: hypothetical protein R3F43_09075 [bacterium]
MRWLHERYNYATSERYRDFWRVSYHYTLWTSAKAGCWPSRRASAGGGGARRSRPVAGGSGAPRHLRRCRPARPAGARRRSQPMARGGGPVGTYAGVGWLVPTTPTR